MTNLCPIWKKNVYFLTYNLDNNVPIRGQPFNSWGGGGGGGWFWKKISCKPLSEEKNCMQHKCNRKLKGKKREKNILSTRLLDKIIDDQKSPPPPQELNDRPLSTLKQLYYTLTRTAGISSSPDSSHFVRHHADDYLWRERQKNKKLLLFAGHIHDKRNFCLLAEEFPFILLANLSAAEAILCILE